jgi:hypothetical protein
VIPPDAILTRIDAVVGRVDAVVGQVGPGGGMDLGVLLVVLFVIGAIAVAVAQWRRLQRKRADLGRLLERDGLRPTSAPCGLSADQLAGAFVATPRGDRRYGTEYGVAGPLAVSAGGRDLELDCASFRWWSEVRRTTHNQNGGTSTRYDKQRECVTLVRLPVAVPDRLVVRPESVLGRVGITRGGHQLESSEFNRRFRVEARDRTLTVHLLDANLQRLLTEEFAGRSIEVVGDLLVLGGRPTHRDGSLTGFIGEIPAMRQDVRRLLSAVPPAFWRQVGLGREED